MSFDVYNFMLRLTPWFLRKAKFCAWLFVLAKGLQPIVDLFGELVVATDYALKFNCEIQYLELVLNETFPSDGDDIYIETIFAPQFYLYNKIEARPPIYFYNESEGEDPTYLHNEQENAGLNQYIVWIPVELDGNQIAIAALVDQYNLAGCVYTIQIIP